MSDFLIIGIITVSSFLIIMFIEYKKAMKAMNSKDYLIRYSDKCQELKKENLSAKEYKKRCLAVLENPEEYEKALKKYNQIYNSIVMDDETFINHTLTNRKYAYKHETSILEIFTPAIHRNNRKRATCEYLKYSYIINSMCQKFKISEEEATHLFEEWYEHDMVKRKYNDPESITLGSTLVFFGDFISTKDLTMDKWAYYNNL